MDDMVGGMDMGIGGGDMVMGGLMDDLQAGVMNAQMAGDASHHIVMENTPIAMPGMDMGLAADPMAALTSMGDVMGGAGIQMEMSMGGTGMTDISADPMAGMFGMEMNAPAVDPMFAAMGAPAVDPMMMDPMM